MRYVQGTDLSVERETAVTLGKFDGMHRGHQDLLREMTALQKNGAMAVVFTFGTSPYALLNGAKKFLLMTNQEKEAYCERLGVDLLVEYPFTDAVCKMSPEAFIEKVLVEGLKARYIIVGTDFCFGYKRQGNVALLKRLEEGKKEADLAIRKLKNEIIRKEKDSNTEIAGSCWINVWTKPVARSAVPMCEKSCKTVTWKKWQNCWVNLMR